MTGLRRVLRMRARRTRLRTTWRRRTRSPSVRGGPSAVNGQEAPLPTAAEAKALAALADADEEESKSDPPPSSRRRPRRPRRRAQARHGARAAVDNTAERRRVVRREPRRRRARGAGAADHRLLPPTTTRSTRSSSRLRRRRPAGVLKARRARLAARCNCGTTRRPSSAGALSRLWKRRGAPAARGGQSRCGQGRSSSRPRSAAIPPTPRPPLRV